MNPSPKKRLLLGIEFTLLCLGLPTLIITQNLAPYMFAFLWGMALYTLAVMRFTPSLRQELRKFWELSRFTKPALTYLLIRTLIAGMGMTVFMALYDPTRMFDMLGRNPAFVPVLCILYPILSALPQELIFCKFFFARYSALFGHGRMMILVSAGVFAYAHMLYINPVAPFLSFIGGLIFAYSYAKHKSLALVTLEHGLYGDILFIVGLGWYFWTGAIALP
ncbi:MAG: CPBP family intramembrane glutamic endopeptidase [Pseudobdellovibrionaceae bacterium]